MLAWAWSPRCILRRWLSCCRWEYGPFAITLSRAGVGCSSIACSCSCCRGRASSAALALALVVLLIVLSRFKFDILQLSLTFLDFLIVDRDTFSFLLSVFPRLRTQLIVAAVLAVPVLWLIWRADPFRVGRRLSLAVLAATTLLMSVMSVAVPEQPWEPFQGVNHISNLARSGVVAVSRLTSTGWIEADPRCERPAGPGSARRRPAGAAAGRDMRHHGEAAAHHHAARRVELRCHRGTRRQGAAGLRRLLQVRSTAVRRTMVAEATGGPTWYTEFNVLTGMSARSFGDLKFYVTRIAAGRVTRGLPQALQRCGYKTILALSDLWRLPRRAHLPEGHRRRAVHRHGGHGRRRGHAARQVLLRSGPEGVCGPAAVAVAGLHVRVPHGQSFSLDQRLSARSDAGLDAAGQYRGDR